MFWGWQYENPPNQGIVHHVKHLRIGGYKFNFLSFRPTNSFIPFPFSFLIAAYGKHNCEVLGVSLNFYFSKSSSNYSVHLRCFLELCCLEHMPYFMLCIFQLSALCTRFHLCGSSMSVLSSFIFSHATFSIKFILLFSSNNLPWEVGNSSHFLLCGISEVSQAVCVACMTGLHDFLKAILVLVSSAHECLFLRLFSQAIWHLRL